MCRLPNLGCATTRELLEEVATRVEMHRYEDTTSSSEIEQIRHALEMIAQLRLHLLAYGPSLDYRTIDIDE